MSEDYIPLKSFKSLGLWSPNRYELDLLNEVLNIDFGQEGAKVSEVNVGGQNDHPGSNSCARGQLSWQIIFSTSNFDL